jgi:NAD(P)-dependent dehydrogenase (short-subunit alcohol dehydrogenase family)
MMFLVEAFDNELKRDGKRVGAIAPGAFPSRMQKVVADSSEDESGSPERINQAKKVLAEPTDATKLIKMINFLIKNPNSAGGRIWSANYDEFCILESNSEFGKLRRKID